MKIENVQSIKNIPEKQQPQLFRQGEFFVSEVLEVRGETALLKSAQGMLLTARLLGDLGLASGDHVETVVDEAHGTRYVLRLLDVSRGDGQAATGGQETAKASANAGAQGARAQVLHGMLAMLKKNAGMEPKMAEFMAKNGIPDTPENIETLTRLVKGDLKTAQVLTQIQGEAARAGTVSANKAASLGQTDIFEPMTAPATTTTIEQAQTFDGITKQLATGTVESQQFSAEAGITSNNNTAQLQQPAAQLQQPAAQLQQPAAQLQQRAVAGMPEVAEPTGQPLMETLANVPADPQSPMAVTNRPTDGSAVKQQVVAEMANPVITTGRLVDAPEPVLLASQLLSFMVDIRDRRTLPVQLKKAVEELPAQIKELKISLKTADNTDRNTLALKADSLDRQFAMMSELKRFDCYHIPFTGMNREQETAELYVFRQKHRRADASPETFAILLGLDTLHMGRVETMIRATGCEVSLEFRLEMAELSDVFTDGAKTLEPMITQAGFKLTGVSARELTVRTTVLNAEEAQPEGQAHDTGSLDIRV